MGLTYWFWCGIIIVRVMVVFRLVMGKLEELGKEISGGKILVKERQHNDILINYRITLNTEDCTSTLSIIEKLFKLSIIYYRLYCVRKILELLNCNSKTYYDLHISLGITSLDNISIENTENYMMNTRSIDLHKYDDIVELCMLIYKNDTIPIIYHKGEIIAHPCMEDCSLKITDYTHHCPPKLVIKGLADLVELIFFFHERKEYWDLLIKEKGKSYENTIIQNVLLKLELFERFTPYKEKYPTELPPLFKTIFCDNKNPEEIEKELSQLINTLSRDAVRYNSQLKVTIDSLGTAKEVLNTMA